MQAARCKAGLNTPGKLQQSGIAERGSDQRDTEGQTVGAKSGRDCNRGKVQKVDEVGVVAEIRIQLNRIVFFCIYSAGAATVGKFISPEYSNRKISHLPFHYL